MPLPERAAAAVRTVDRADQPVLLVLDNVERWTEREHPGPLPGGAHVRALVTTRARSLGGHRFRHVELGFLDPDAAKAPLRATSGRADGPVAALDALLAYLGGHALAVELAGAYLREFPEVSCADYFRRLGAGEAPDEAVSDLVRYEATAARAFATIWERLPDDVRRAWRVTACFAPEPVGVVLPGWRRAARRLARRVVATKAWEPDGGLPTADPNEALRARPGARVQRSVRVATPPRWATSRPTARSARMPATSGPPSPRRKAPRTEIGG